ncbi:MAG: sterol desaturase family protein [Verrucomicrobiales bacterium]
MTVSFLLWLSATFVVGIVYASFFEWALHKYVMHRPVGKFRYAFQAHAVVHHQTFKADETYHLIHDEDKHTIPMAWWNGPVLVVSCSAPFWVTGLIFGNWAMVTGGLLAGVAYYSTYEYLHWCMHLPKQRQIEKPWFFRRLNGHHLLHHRYMHKNFNVVLPFADLCLGTLMSRSPICFNQAKGDSVPNVQPLITNIEQATISADEKKKAS